MSEVEVTFYTHDSHDLVVTTNVPQVPRKGDRVTIWRGEGPQLEYRVDDVVWNIQEDDDDCGVQVDLVEAPEFKEAKP